jgi:hypothetical protein
LGALALVVILILGYLIYTYKPITTCSDGRQNGGEAGVDCGGNCAKICVNQATALKVLWVRVLPVSRGVYAATALVENPNPQAGVKKLNYTFRLVDNKNILVNVRSGETFINPGEKFLIFEGGINVGEGKPARAFLELGRVEWQKTTKRPPLLTVDNKSFLNGEPARLTANITNRSIADLRLVLVPALLSDESGNAIAAGFTYLERLPRDGALAVFYSWPTSLTTVPSFIELFPRVSVFDLP